VAKGAFWHLEMDDDTLSALLARAPEMPLDGFIYAVSRYVAPSDKVTPEQVRYELGGRDAEPLRGIASKAAALQEALSERSLGASDYLTMCAHRYGRADLPDRLQRDLRSFLDLCEMARRDANAAIRPGRNLDANTELVSDLAGALRGAGKPADARDDGSLVQAFDIAQTFARRVQPKVKRVSDPAGTVRKALAVLRKK
jgi:hypothetical protein